MDYRILASASERRIADNLSTTIEKRLSKMGLLCRVFGRVKSPSSLDAKLRSKGDTYELDGKKMQDLFGVRVVLYFSDDSEVAQRVVMGLYDHVEASVSHVESDVFGPTRCNHVFRLPKDLAEQSAVIKTIPLIDDTFEVQFRTVFSEGWHEVEHDLRYKRKSDWSSHTDLGRALNGVMATLETCDWSLLKIFDDLAYRHYKSGNVPAMVQSRFRLRTSPDPPGSETLWALFADDSTLIKKVFRSDRAALLDLLLAISGPLPINSTNIVYLLNYISVHDDKIANITPRVVRDLLERYNSEQQAV